MKLVVGLGNPGRDYTGTRHNVGFAVVDRVAADHRVARFQDRFQAECAEWFRDGDKILLAKPQTYMNLSGNSVRQLVDFYQLAIEHLLVVCDDVNLPLGKLRFRARGNHGGHNGLRSIQQHLGTPDYSRLRIGVGAAEGDLIQHVLSHFRAAERPVIDEAVATAAASVLLWIDKGIEFCMNTYNG
jgi:PTH1 family peptidyl-tRNA hydrolase